MVRRRFRKADNSVRFRVRAPGLASSTLAAGSIRHEACNAREYDVLHSAHRHRYRARAAVLARASVAVARAIQDDRQSPRDLGGHLLVAERVWSVAWCAASDRRASVTWTRLWRARDHDAHGFVLEPAAAADHLSAKLFRNTLIVGERANRLRMVAVARAMTVLDIDHWF